LARSIRAPNPPESGQLHNLPSRLAKRGGFLFVSRTDATHNNSSTSVGAIGFHLSQIHFVNFSMKGSATDAEFFGSGGDVAVCRIYQDLTFRLHALNENSR
jgi:hypothetical protein